MKLAKKRYLELGALFVAVGVDTTLLARGAEALAARFETQKKGLSVRPASIKHGPVSVALPNGNGLYKIPIRGKKMSDTSSALPESPEVCPFAQRALSTGQQTVINKLFHRLIIIFY